jgi:hypothetical protein
VGNLLRVTQVKHLHNHSANSSVPIFETNDSQSLMKRITDNGRSAPAGGSEILRIFQWKREVSYPVPDVSFCCRIVSWRLTQDSVDGFVGFEIHLVDPRRSTILLQFPLPSCLLHRKSLYPWLHRGSSILIRYVTIREYDAKHDILIALRTEHTTIELLSNSLSTKFPGEVDASDLILRLNAIPLDVEEVRMTSLRSGKEYFLPEEKKSEEEAVVVMESCERRRHSGVEGSVVSTKTGLAVAVNRSRCRLNERLEMRLRAESTGPRSLRGEFLVANRRFLNKGTQELLREEFVVIEYFEFNPRR